jgi:hypothetical protein
MSSAGTGKFPAALLISVKGVGDRIGFADVTWGGHGSAARSLDRGYAARPVLRVAAEDAHRCSEAGELGGNGLPEASAATGDHDHTANVGARNKRRDADGRRRSEAGRSHEM